MKKSHIAAWSVLGFAVLCVLMALIIGRVILGNGNDWDNGTVGNNRGSSGSGEVWEESSDISGFDTILVEGLWDIRIIQGDTYSVDVSYPASWGRESALTQRGDALVLGFPRFHENVDESASASITMASLESLGVNGAGSITFKGFESESLDIDIEGAAMVKGLNSRIGRVSILVAGGGLVDFEDTPTRDVEVNLEGAGQVKLDMDGGVLEGRLEGVGRIVYSGTVSEERVVVDGIGQVKYQR